MKKKNSIAILIGTVIIFTGLMIVPSLEKAQAVGPNAMRAGFDDITLARNDDGSSSRENIGFTINFFGTSYSSLWVNNNGNLTFDNAMWTYTPFNLYTAGRVIIAPFFADVDTRYAGDPVQYQLWAVGQNTVDGHPAFGATWRNVDYYFSSPSHTNRNHFQVILIDRSDTGLGNFDIEFNYDQIQWEAGTASGGTAQGLGGSSVRAGYSDGTAANSYELPGSGVNGAFLDSNPNGLIHRSMNSPQLGRYVFAVHVGIPIEADLAITKSDSPDPVNAGQNLTYTLNVSNSGPDTATGVIATDTLPAGVNFVSASVPSSVSGNVVTCNLGNINSGSAVGFIITVAVTSSAASSITNTASVGANEPDPNNVNNTASATTAVILNQPPVADFTYVPASPTEGSAIQFTDTSTDPDNNITTWSWTFGDGGTSNVQNPSHTYGDNGSYSVTLTVTDAGGLTNIKTRTVTVSNVAPTVDAGLDQTVNEGDTVNFSGSFTDPGWLDTHTIAWEFGDGSPAVTGTLTPTYAYGDNGVYTVTLTITDDDGGIGQDTLSVTVDNVAPTVEAGPDQTVTAGDTVNFSGSFTDPGWLDTHTATWDFGDTTGVTNTLTPSHVYYGKDIYTVTLTVTDDNGGVGSDTLTVTVKPIPATIDCDPDTLNLKSKGEWITCYIELPPNYDVWQINGSTVSLNGIPAYLGKEGWAKSESNESNIMDHDGDGILERMVKSERAKVQAILNPGEAVVLTLTGKVFYNAGLADFEGTDTIRVIK